jgi:hypothetical protein
MAIPCLRDFLLPNVKVVAVGVAGGEEGPACWEKLKLGVVGRMIASDCMAVECMYVRMARMLRNRWVKASTPAADISNKEKKDEAD